ncbi:MAG: sigma-70 family RNA polymerase sigma factor [Candidatus Eiseniibacteriota bacterium]|nr:MAG: sigma-70 family RNA polymerase sigma factor [Candidatus Eisenbacteria bacterium]
MQGSLTLVKSEKMGDNGIHSLKETVNRMIESREEPTLDELVRRGERGDEKALEAIYHRFKTPLFNLACRYTGDETAAEDVLQEVFLKAFTRLSDMQDTSRFPGWLFRIATNACLGHVRQKKAERLSSAPLTEMEEILHAQEGREPDIARRMALEKAIQTLPERLRCVFLLHDVEGFKHEEIARILGCAVGTSKSQLFKARLRLRDHLAKFGPM